MRTEQWVIRGNDKHLEIRVQGSEELVCRLEGGARQRRRRATTIATAPEVANALRSLIDAIVTDAPGDDVFTRSRNEAKRAMAVSFAPELHQGMKALRRFCEE